MKKWDIVIPCITNKINDAININDILVYDLSNVADHEYQIVHDRINNVYIQLRYLYTQKLLTIKDININNIFYYVICSKDHSFDIIEQMMADVKLIPTMNNKEQTIDTWIALSADQNVTISLHAIWTKNKQTCLDIFRALTLTDDIGVI